MSPTEKAAYIKTHFSKQCTVHLVDIMKKRRGRPRRYSRKQLAVTEHRENVGRKKYSCYICFKKFSTKEELNDHKSGHSDEDDDVKDEEDFNDEGEPERMNILSVLDAPEENNETSLASNDSDERILIETKSKYKCVSCNVDFDNQDDIKTHVHIQYRCKYQCKNCSRMFNTKGGFIVHVLQHGMKNLPKLYRCDHCPFTFQDYSQLKRHNYIVHSVITPVQKIETSSFPEVDDDDVIVMPELDNPMTGNFPIFDCDVCYDVFASSRALKRHKAYHAVLENKTSMNSTSREDDVITFVQKDESKSCHEPIASFITVIKADSIPKPVVEEKNQLSAPPPPPPPPPPVVEASHLTAQISQMLGGNVLSVASSHPFILPKMEPAKLPTLVPVSRSVLKRNLQSKGNVLKKVKPQEAKKNSSLLSGGQVFMINQGPPSSIANSSAYQQPIVSGSMVSGGPSTSTVTNAPFLLNTNISTSDGTASPIFSFPGMNPNSTILWLVPSTTVPSQNSPISTVSTSNTTINPAPQTILESIPSSNEEKQSVDEVLTILDSPTESQDKSEEEDNEGDNSDFVMPIITSITTVPEESKKSAKQGPTSIYETEFVKFIGGKKKTPPPLIDLPQKNQMFVLDEDPLNVNLPETDPLQTDVAASNLPTLTNTSMPKIFVKKLTDLLDVTKKPSESAETSNKSRFCQESFDEWNHYRFHMEARHKKYVCQFFKCQVSESYDEYKAHMKEKHFSCQKCGGKYLELSKHEPHCGSHIATNIPKKIFCIYRN